MINCNSFGVLREKKVVHLDDDLIYTFVKIKNGVGTFLCARYKISSFFVCNNNSILMMRKFSFFHFICLVVLEKLEWIDRREKKKTKRQIDDDGIKNMLYCIKFQLFRISWNTHHHLCTVFFLSLFWVYWHFVWTTKNRYKSHVHRVARAHFSEVDF